jgi:Tfp pilus assembly protein PilF
MAHRDLGIVYASTGRNDAAIKELKRAIELDGQDIAPHWRLAKLYQAMGKKDEAKAEFAISSKMHQQANEALTEKMSGPPPTQP